MIVTTNATQTLEGAEEEVTEALAAAETAAVK